jgi:prepilin-type N-terminal cleavage/methylation domain-containing protein
LLYEPLVVLGIAFMSAGVRASRRASRRRTRERGFSLIELMVVIIIIGVVAALAVPTMAAARIDRNAYDDAGSIMQLLRSARTRAVARGGAVLVSMTLNGPSDRGTFWMYDSVQVNPGGVGGANRAPVASCKTPTVWSPVDPTANTGIALVDGLNLNGTIEQEADIETELRVYNPGGAINDKVNTAYLCFTPLGHTYFTTGLPVFDGALPMLSPLEFRVTRMVGGAPVGTIRSVVLPPNGMARVFSHV